MAATETSSASSVLHPLSRSQILEKLRLKRRSTANTPKPSAAVLYPKKRKCCLCYPTTHPGSFRCAVHRRLAKENIEILLLNTKQRRRSGTKTSSSGLNMRKTAMMNSLAGIGSVEAERCMKYLKESMVKPSSLRIRCVFRPRRSRFYALHKD